MGAKPQQPMDRDRALLELDGAIQVLDLAEKGSNIPPAKVVYDLVGILLATIRDSKVNELDHVELGLFCTDICEALDRGVCGKEMDRLTKSVCDAIDRLALIAADIQRKLVKWGKRNVVSGLLHARDDKRKIAAWRSDLDEILQVFNKELATRPNTVVFTVRRDAANTHPTVSSVRNDVVNAHTSVSDDQRNELIHPQDAHDQDWTTHASVSEESLPPPSRSTHGAVSEDVASTNTMVSEFDLSTLKSQDEVDNKHGLTQASIPGELPPLPPRTLFGRDELIERVVDLAENHFPITLVGAGGIGKTSIALTVLHHDRIKKRFGDDRRFIRCDQFPASRCHLLRRLSSVIGAGIENPEDLTPLRTYLSSRKMLIVLDNAESILDTQGTDAQKIHAIVEELGRFDNICICITSRNPPTPLRCERLDVPTLSMDAALDTFYHIYGANNRSNIVNGIPEELDFHPLSITLLATAARQNKWDANRLATEWGKQRTTMVQAEHNKNLAAAIEFSLASPMFQQLGHDARALLGVVAFFPQGVDENNLTWLFPTITNRTDVFNKFCILSLTQRSNGFITMFAPLRGYLSPKDPMSSPLLCTTMERYFSRMSNFGETRWVTSEEANIEHLLDVFTTIDGNSNGVWEACINFMKHFVRHKNRSGSLKLKMEALPDDHPSKPGCLYELSWLCRIGNDTERKRLLTRALKLYNERGNDPDIAKTLVRLSHVNRTMDRRKEGIRQARQALEILEWLGDTKGQIDCLIGLARLLRRDKQLDAAKEVASRAIGLIPEKGNQYQACETHHILGRIYRSKGDGEKAIHHFEEAIGIASSLNWHHELLWVYWSLAELFSHQGKSDDARAHLERAKSHAVGNTYGLGHVMFRQAWFWFKEHRLEEVRSEVLRAAEIFEKLGAAKELEQCRVFLRTIRFLQVIRFPWGMQKKLSRPTTSVQSVSNSRGTNRWYQWLR